MASPVDWNICEHCDLFVDAGARACPDCRQALVIDARGKLSVWRLGDLEDGIVGPLIARLRRNLGLDVVLQPGFLDPRPSERPQWKGRSEGV